jgi:hypothetical protein
MADFCKLTDDYGDGYLPAVMLPYSEKIDFSDVTLPAPFAMWLQGHQTTATAITFTCSAGQNRPSSFAKKRRHPFSRVHLPASRFMVSDRLTAPNGLLELCRFGNGLKR